jgi:hypothetical protein
LTTQVSFAASLSVDTGNYEMIAIAMMNTDQIRTNDTMIATFSVYDPNSVKELLKGANLVTVYPNPAGEAITLDWIAESTNNVSIKIVDMNGRTLMQERLAQISKGEKVVFDINKLTGGVYFINIKTDSQQSSLRVIKQ